MLKRELEALVKQQQERIEELENELEYYIDNNVDIENQLYDISKKVPDVELTIDKLVREIEGARPPI